MDKLNLFIPITKVDAAQRLVYGIATAETEDRSGEVCDYASTKPFYEKWSGDIAKSTDGKSLGNVRAMHGKVAAGKVTSLTFNDEAKQIEICAKVVDDTEWKKVEEGVYSGFSQGGSYVKRWKDDAGLQRYTADPSEVSLVDLPCLPTATFQMIKADGAVELRKFHAAETAPDSLGPTATEILVKAQELAKAAGHEAAPEAFFEAARAALAKVAAPAKPDVAKAAESVPAPVNEGGVEQVWLAKDKTPFAKKADALAHNATLDAAAAARAVAGPVLDVLADIGKKIGVDAKPQQAVAKKDYSDDERTAMASSGEAMKDGGFPIKSRDDLDSAVKAYGGAKNKAAAKRHVIKRAKALKATDALPAGWSGSTKSDKAATGANLEKDASFYSVSSLISLLAQMEQAEECLEAGSDDGGYYFYYGPSNGTRVEVSKEVTDRFGAMLGQFGDLIAEVLDAVLAEMKGEESSEAMEAAAPIINLIKAGARHSKKDMTAIQAVHDTAIELGATCDAETEKHAHGPLGKAVEDALSKMTADRDSVLAKYDALQKVMTDQIMPMLKTIAAQPVPVHLIGRAIEKTKDGLSDVSESAPAEDAFLKMAPEERATLLIKLAQKNPRQMSPAT